MESNHDIMLMKNNLEAYKLLNRDLSKKVQELKLFLNQQNQILEVTRTELMEERINTAKFKHFIKTNITMCSQFFSNVISNLNECIVTTDLDMSIPETYDPDRYLGIEEINQAGPSTRVNPKTSKIHQINMMCKNNAKDRDDILYTIVEDQQSLLGKSIEEALTTQISNESDRRQSLRISTPNTSTCPPLHDFQNITKIPTLQITPSICRQDTPNSCTISSINSSTNLSLNTIQRTPQKTKKRDSWDPRRLSISEAEPVPKKKSMSIELSAVSLTENQLQEYLDKYNNDDNDIDYDNDSLISGSSTIASATSNTSATASTKRKSRAKVEPVKRRGRPKRKVALNVSLAEKSCRTKLRRSK